ncbi:hypothetical protein PIB30_028566, partial [Stylosanthes scabra]|nr:hypothetical protein [Stylosanthes scabra]
KISYVEVGIIMVVPTELILLNQLNEGGLELEIIGLNHWPSDGAATTIGSWIDVLTKSDSVLIVLKIEIIIMCSAAMFSCCSSAACLARLLASLLLLKSVLSGSES